MLQPTTVTSLEALAMMVGCVLGAGFMACFLIALTGDGIVHRVAGDAARNPAVVVRPRSSSCAGCVQDQQRAHIDFEVRSHRTRPQSWSCARTGLSPWLEATARLAGEDSLCETLFSWRSRSPFF